jgi:hypothetical protein
MLEFTDGVRINTDGPLRARRLKDGWYAIGEGMCIPASDAAEAREIVDEMRPVQPRQNGTSQ